MKPKTIISVRSNCDFSLNYESSMLHPKAEIILITTQPKYKLNTKKGELTKEQDVEEFRFNAGLDGINKLIGELQLVVKNMNAFEQVASSFNAIIENSKTKESNP
jgi:hypothetical protein